MGFHAPETEGFLAFTGAFFGFPMLFLHSKRKNADILLCSHLKITYSHHSKLNVT
jgi:hypothetical protein